MKYISILRGINVAGQRKILMNDLKELYQNLGFERVQTYIQSGNVIFETHLENKEEISTQLEKAIFENYNFEVCVIIRTKEELLYIQSSNPFFSPSQTTEEKQQLINNNLYFTFLKDIPTPESSNSIEKIKFLPDRFEIINDAIFILYAEKYSNSKLTNNFFEKKLKTKATTRNWKTIEKLTELMTKEE